jgi:YggT family protein
MTHSLAYIIIDGVFWLYMIFLAIRILSSWFFELQGHPIVQFIAFYTDPYLNLFRRFIPPLGMLDLSPMVAFFALGVLEQIVKGIFCR